MHSTRHLLSLIALVVGVQVSSAKYEPNWQSLDSRPIPQWFDDSKIGIFIHWGVFSVPSFGSEWFWWSWQHVRDKNYVNFMTKNYRPDFTYADFASQFTAEFYDPNKWAEIFKASGAKYVVLTTKHHEGFTMWPSKTSFNWNAMDVGPKRDLLGDFATAIRSAGGLKLGVYHSLIEWFNPLYLNDKKNNLKTRDFVTMKTMPELEDLVNTYKPDLIFSDGEWEPESYWNSTNFLTWLFNDSPVKDTIVVNDRWCKECTCKHGGYHSCLDRFNPGVLQPHKFENAMTLDKVSWAFRRNAELKDYFTTHELITTIVQTVSCGGNILINVGPTRDGVIAPIYEERLRELGSWLGTNGDAIYASKPWTKQNDTITKDVWYTSKDKTVYPIVLSWPQNNQLLLGAVDPKTVNSIELLGHKGNLEFKEQSGSTLVTFPTINPESLRWAYVLKIVTK